LGLGDWEIEIQNFSISQFPKYLPFAAFDLTLLCTDLTSMKRVFLRVLSLLILLFAGGYCMGQSCPVNIGFESGNFNGWTCLNGTIDKSGIISLAPGQPIDGKHTIYKNASPQLKDTFGGFAVNCPNGSGYSIKLGNKEANAEAQAVTYTFTIPAGQNDYSIIFNYAVVLQNPEHKDHEQPKFTSKVFDVTDNKYLECGSFQFIADDKLPGFKESNVEPNIFYKDWAPVTIKVSGYAGKSIRLEFTANDCTQGIHFGYAYLDVDENCTTPITGNTYCNGTGAVVLKAPYGFKEYKWFDQSSNLLGIGNTLRLDPPPAGNTIFKLEIVPFPGQGCQDTLQTTIIASSDYMKLQLKDSVSGCPSTGVDITASAITAGSTPGLNLQYFTDSTQREILSNPMAISKAGSYYIKGTAPSGCSEIKPIQVLIKKPPGLVINQPISVCAPSTADITIATVTAGSETGSTYSYWKDTSATVPLSNPQSIASSGKYFIKAVNTTGCSTVLPVSVNIGEAPAIVISDIHGCGELVFSKANAVAGSDPSVQFSYWQDAAATIAVPSSQVYTANSVLYAKALAKSGCAIVRPVNVFVHAYPVFTVTDPPPTTRPATVDLSTTVPVNAAWTYSYWLDEQASKLFTQPFQVALSGTYYIKATDPYGCGTLHPVNVQIIDPPVIPPNAFSPNEDGVNDNWSVPILSAYANCVVEVYTRNGRIVYRSVGYAHPWDGRYNGKVLPADTYYYLIRLSSGKPPISGSVTILK
jgi:gliding motility-associated-like protein